MTKFSLIITAGGTSSRYGTKNKLIEYINDKTVIEHTISAFLKFDNITEIIIPTNKAVREEFEHLFNDKRIELIEGGDTRQKSVNNALEFVTNDYVIIHDGARPLIKESTIAHVMDSVIEHSAVSVMTKTTDTIKEVDENGKILSLMSAVDGNFTLISTENTDFEEIREFISFSGFSSVLSDVPITLASKNSFSLFKYCGNEDIINNNFDYLVLDATSTISQYKKFYLLLFYNV